VLRLAATIILCACAALVGISCAGSERDERGDYERAMREHGVAFDTAIERLEPKEEAGKMLPPAPSDVETAAETIRALSEKIDTVDAPKAVAPAHRNLVDGVRTLSESLDELATDLIDAAGEQQRHDAYTAFETSEKTKAAYALIDDARAGFERADYDVLAESS
jgi:hypothetical protein